MLFHGITTMQCLIFFPKIVWPPKKSGWLVHKLVKHWSQWLSVYNVISHNCSLGMMGLERHWTNEKLSTQFNTAFISMRKVWGLAVDIKFWAPVKQMVSGLFLLKTDSRGAQYWKRKNWFYRQPCPWIFVVENVIHPHCFSWLFFFLSPTLFLFHLSVVGFQACLGSVSLRGLH